MKKLTILSAIAMIGLIYSTASAQVSFRIGFHFGTPVAVHTVPVYSEPAPVAYDNDDDYYYLPDVDAYYSVNDECYYYFDGDNWISAAYLPGEYRDYDWRTMRRVEIRASRPFMHDDMYRSRYHGHEMTGWARTDNHERFDAPSQHDYGRRFDNRFHGGYQRPAPQDNGYRFGNREQGGYNQPAPQNNGQRFNNGEQGSTSQSAQPGRGQRGYDQPSNNQGGYDHDNNGQHYVGNSPQGGFSARRITRF